MFKLLLDEAMIIGNSIVGVRVGFETVILLLFNGCYIAFFLVGAMFIIDGSVSVIDVFQLLLYVFQALQGAIMLINSMAQVAECTGASHRIFEIIATHHDQVMDKRLRQELLDRALLLKRTHEIEDFDGSIEFVSVSFAYKDKAPVLKEITFKVMEGMTVALVGSSGGGKSTIVSMIEGFYSPTKGDILVGGQNLNNVDLPWIHANLVTIVSQEPSMFSGTVRSNIMYGRPDASDERVEEVARLANAHDFIVKLDGGYDVVWLSSVNGE